ncbi:DUF4810 domain-containing protein [Opitutus sp. ER46]|uniref:DUF4810 domain-containing protein n=1 Tax=Opitutus sp. ER46 TaxID=2161864 RepID=UPI000D312DD7|nr:DUF4810 domain-containing protein [Opitutus sp. ER46]PTX97759.1 DUF4810 domain-containing protein [Opitutus sp. ER46]
MNPLIRCGTFVLLLALVGCQTARPLYYWGRYETSIYQGYSAPQKASPERQIELMLEDEQKAAAANLPVHPGFHAHLGYLYEQVGKSDLARKEFEAEKRLFPESAQLMDRLLNQKPPTPAKS